MCNKEVLILGGVWCGFFFVVCLVGVLCGCFGVWGSGFLWFFFGVSFCLGLFLGLVWVFGISFSFLFLFFGSWFLIFCGFDSLAGSFLGDSPKPPFFFYYHYFQGVNFFLTFQEGFLIALQAACGVFPTPHYY